MRWLPLLSLLAVLAPCGAKADPAEDVASRACSALASRVAVVSGDDPVFLRSYDAGGGVLATSAFPGDVANGANQSTLLLATPEAEAEFGVAADAPLAPAGQLSPAGGAVCWETIDCVAWGSFTGGLPSPAGAPAAASGIPDGMALRRTIGRGCPTALDIEDDSNSGSDFEAVFPTPRSNSTPPSEVLCGASSGGSDSPTPSGGSPQTRLRHKPPKRTTDRTPGFRFTADNGSATFQCRLDRRRFRRCRSPFTSPRLSFGPHRFQVRAVGPGGQVDLSPATYRFRVVRPG